MVLLGGRSQRRVARDDVRIDERRHRVVDQEVLADQQVAGGRLNFVLQLFPDHLTLRVASGHTI